MYQITAAFRLGGYRPQIPVLSVLCSQLNLLYPPPEKNSWVRHCAQRLQENVVTLTEKILRWKLLIHFNLHIFATVNGSDLALEDTIAMLLDLATIMATVSSKQQ